MKQARTLSWLVALLPLLLAACGSDAVAPDPDPTVSGSWSGTTGTTTLSLTMNEADSTGVVTGSGNITDTGVAFALSISSGTHVFPNLSLILSATGFQDINLTGTVSETAIAATINGSGFMNVNINMTKQ